MDETYDTQKEAEAETRLATARADALREAADVCSAEMDELLLLAQKQFEDGNHHWGHNDWARRKVGDVAKAILALIDQPGAPQPTPEAVARAALEWAAEYVMSQIGLGESEPWMAGNNSGVRACRGTIRAAARDPATLAAIIAITNPGVYRRADLPPTLAEALAVPGVAALVEAAWAEGYSDGYHTLNPHKNIVGDWLKSETYSALNGGRK
jgi:hypothetical protein